MYLLPIRGFPHCFSALLMALVFTLPPVARATPAAAAQGIQLQCGTTPLEIGKRGMNAYLVEMRLAPNLWAGREDAPNGTLTYTLTTPPEDTNTLDFLNRPEYWVTEKLQKLPGRSPVQTVSPKEILLALLQHGRLSSFAGKDCGMQALKEHVGVRQNIVSWSENMEWGWPEGGPARWNQRYWHRGTPIRQSETAVALHDAMVNPQRYAVGCFAAAKMVLAHSVLDYYQRVLRDPAKTNAVKASLLSDGEPLMDIEPGAMWFFEEGFDAAEAIRPGKLLELQQGVAARNFIPGDWVYFLNTDPKTAAKTGYEGSNSIYLGRGRFSDYYNDNNHFYSYEQKLDEVYQWRHGIFSRSRDYLKAVTLSPADLERLGRSPENGGLLLAYRAVPLQVGHKAPAHLHKP